MVNRTVPGTLNDMGKFGSYLRKTNHKKAYIFMNWVSIGSGNGSAPSHYLNQCWLIVNLTYCHLKRISVKFGLKFWHLHSRKYAWKCRLWNGGLFVPGKMSSTTIRALTSLDWPAVVASACGGAICANESGADSKCAPGQWEMALLCNDISNWLGANLEKALPVCMSWEWPRFYVLQSG